MVSALSVVEPSCSSPTRKSRTGALPTATFSVDGAGESERDGEAEEDERAGTSAV
jgi:hypothetical protein